MLDRRFHRAIEATALAGGARPEAIASALACLDGRSTRTEEVAPGKLLTQAGKARQLGVSRFTVRRLVTAGKLHPVELLPGLFRYRADELIERE